MLSRNENGKLRLKSLDMEIFLGDLFEECNDWKEVDWLEEQLVDMVNCLAEQKRDELE